MLIISPSIRLKLSTRHSVSQEEIEQCFANREGAFLVDSREEHRTDPPTQWFVAETDIGRKLKVVFIEKNGDMCIKTAYEPSEAAIGVYEKRGL